MEGLTSIRILQISDCWDLKSLHPQAVKQYLADLEELQIESCQIFHSLEGIGGLSALKALRIRDLPKLVAFPEELGDLKSLRKLHIENCRNLSSLPQGMRRLSDLKSTTSDFLFYLWTN
ncbi:PREDICTED: leucine-rich repeat protein soc-2 homolog [Nelumbo nucifera]|uniref:Leucine-rich repeat protein soc-2 homolog n=1 Tax=Nelumbo nucifera TaxID=4432 RepID=A0A1U8BPB0_NELNU|nr:PREDICTED: leucine-rich repeat protein soc-2 homolog [Nelumbo nucifera]